MLFEQLRAGGCLSYIAGCEKTCAGVIVDPALDLVDRYVALTVEKGLRIRYVIDSHTHADHFSAARELARQLGARIVMHRRSAAPFADMRVDDGELLVVGELRVGVIHTPGHTDDSMPTCRPAIPRRSTRASSGSSSLSTTRSASSRRTITRGGSRAPSEPRRRAIPASRRRSGLRSSSSCAVSTSPCRTI